MKGAAGLGPVFLPETQGRRDRVGGGVLRGVPLRLQRKSQGGAPELIGRLDASSMPVMFW